MNMIKEAIITPQIIKWARTKLCNLSLDDAAIKIGTKKHILEKWENGSKLPTINQAYKIAKVYRIPFASLWLENIPTGVKIPKIRDFRRLHTAELGKYSYQLMLQLRDFSTKREFFIELSNNIDKAIKSFDLKINQLQDINYQSSLMRKYLDISFEKQIAWRDHRIAFNTIKSIIESKGILVFQLTRLSVEECRGFSIYHSKFPIIAINRKDSYSGRIFSLIHEFIHICYNSTFAHIIAYNTRK